MSLPDRPTCDHSNHRCALVELVLQPAAKIFSPLNPGARVECCIQWLHPQRSTIRKMLLLLQLLLWPVVAGGKFDRYKSCQACTDAGYGWSVAKGRCGGFANRECVKLAATETALETALEAALETAADSLGADGGSERWLGLRALHQRAKEAHVECKGFECFKSTVDTDLTPWADTGCAPTCPSVVAAHGLLRHQRQARRLNSVSPLGQSRREFPTASLESHNWCSWNPIFVFQLQLIDGTPPSSVQCQAVSRLTPA